MMYIMRALRTGTIQSQYFSIPVKLYPVVQKLPSPVQMLHTQDQSPIGVRYYSKKTGQLVSKKEIVKAISTPQGNAVLIPTPNTTDKSMFPLSHFTDPRHIDWRLLNTAYYVVPKKADSWYDALHQVLYHNKKAAVLQFTTRNNVQTTAILTSTPEILLLFPLRSPKEIAPLPNYRSQAALADKVSALSSALTH